MSDPIDLDAPEAAELRNAIYDPAEYDGYDPFAEQPWEDPARLVYDEHGDQWIPAPGTEAIHQYEPILPPTGDNPDYQTFEYGTQDIEVYWSQVGTINVAAIRSHSQYWERIATILTQTSAALSGRRDALHETWDSPSGEAFFERIGGIRYIMDDWARHADNNARMTDVLANTAEWAQNVLGTVWSHYRWMLAYMYAWPVRAMAIYDPQHPDWTADFDRIVAPVEYQGVDPGGMREDGDYGLESDMDVIQIGAGMDSSRDNTVAAAEDIARRYHSHAAPVMEILADAYTGYHSDLAIDQPRGFPPDGSMTTAGDVAPQGGGLPPIPGGIGPSGFGLTGPPDLGSLPGPGPLDLPLPANPGPATVPAGGFLAGSPSLSGGQPTLFAALTQPDLAGLSPMAGLTPQQQAALATLPLTAQQLASLTPQQLTSLAGEQQARIATAAAASNVALASQAALAAAQQAVSALGLQPVIDRPAFLPGAIPPGAPGSVSPPAGAPTVALPGATTLSTLPAPAGAPDIGLPGTVPPDIVAPAGASPAGTQVAAAAPHLATLPGATAAGPASGSPIPPMIPPPMVPPMAAQQSGRQSGPGAAAAQLPGAAPGVPPPMFVPPGRASQQGRTPTAPQRVPSALPGAAARPRARGAGLTGARGATGYAVPVAPPVAAPGQRQRQAGQQAQSGPAERVSVPGEHDQELWTVKKPKGLIQSAAPHRPAEHGKSIGSPA